MPSNAQRVGTSYPGEQFTMTAEAAKAYADATDDRNPAYPAVAPPMSAVLYTLKAAALPVMDETFIGDTSRILRLLHGEQEIRWNRVVKPGDALSTTSTITSVEDKGSGELVEVSTRSVDAAGAPVVEMTWGFFIRHSKKELAAGAGADVKPSEKKDAAAPAGAPEFEVAWTVAKDQPLRYAEASGDRNPIHTDDNIAKMAGLNGVILHGLCTMAFAQRAIVDRALGGDPAKLRRMKVRFTKPVYPGETITARGWTLEKNPGSRLLAFEVKNAAGEPVLKDGLAELAT